MGAALNKPDYRRLVDPDLNALYIQTHLGCHYGISGIYFLPEALLYFWHAFAQHAAPFKAPFRYLDYGCGQSTLAEGIVRIVGPLLAEAAQNVACRASGPSGVAARQALLPDFLQRSFVLAKQLMEAKTLSVLPQLRHTDLLECVKFDPAIAAFSALPKGRFDYVTCTDVLEHLPDNGILENIIDFIYDIGSTCYFNVSTRPAEQILGDGQNAHCTIQSPVFWDKKLGKERQTHTLTSVFSRDLTSISFVAGIDVSSVLCGQAYDLIDRFGMIDLIPWPPAPEDALDTARMAKRQALQPEKKKIITQNLENWLQHDPSALTHEPIRSLAHRYGVKRGAMPCRCE